MSIRSFRRAGDDVRAVWILAALVLLCGSAIVRSRYENAIAVSYGRSEALSRRIDVNRGILDRSGNLHVLENRAQRDLAKLSLTGSAASSTANLIALLEKSSRSFRTQVVQIQPEFAEANEDAGALESMPVTIRLDGRFRNILAFIADLSRHDTLISVTDTELALSSEHLENGPPRLDATVHAVLYRLRAQKGLGVRIASAQ